jgi:hypothetical protein
MPYCTACGQQNPAAARFCAQCGTRLAPAPGDATGRSVEDSSPTLTFSGPDKVAPYDRQLTPADSAAVASLPPGNALLLVLRGPDVGARFLLDTDVVTAGRHASSDIFLDDVTVSRQHAEFRRDASSYTVRDTGSLNGTYVNRDRVDARQLMDGDEVQIGKYRLVFYAGHPTS